jgi:hypothetical protein
MLLRSLFQRQRWNAAHSQESRSRRDNAPLRHSKLRARFVPRLEALEDRTVLSSYNAATVSDLIADINAANKAGGTNTITLTAPSTFLYVITVVDNTTDGANGLPVIAKKDMLTIIGNGDTIERSTTSGTPDFRLFDVASGASLTLENLTLEDGLAFGSGTSADGGAIYNQGTLVLSGGTVQGSEALGSNGANARFNRPTGDPGEPAAGGGIWSNGSLTLENGSQILGNLAQGGNGGDGGSDYTQGGANGGNGYGGGVYVAGGTANFTTATLSGNSAIGGANGVTGQFNEPPGGPPGSAFGGALYMASGTVSLTGVLVQNNRAQIGQERGNVIVSLPVQEAFGGGVYVAGGTLNLSNSTVQSNSVGSSPLSVAGPVETSGGGIYIASNSTVTLCNDTVQSNTADLGNGGGIFIASGATVYIDSFTVANTINSTDSSGTNGSTANLDGTYILQNC